MTPIEKLKRWNERLLAALARTTSSGRFVPEIDGLRFFAILWVVLFHLNGYVVVKGAAAFAGQAQTDWLSRFCAHGDLGVRLFFVISGFILAVPFAEHHLGGRRPVPLRAYFLRRVTRLEPPYIANLALLAVLLAAAHTTTEAIAPHLAASVLYVHNLVYGRPSLVNFVAWSLEVEIQWYILAPFACSVFAIRSPRGRRAALVALLAALGVLAAHLDPDIWSRAGRSILRYGQFFAAGMLLADLWITRWKAPSPRRITWDLVGLAGWLALWPMDASPALAPFEVVAILVAYAGSLRGRFLNAVVRDRWLVTIGGMCYTIYLYHAPVISAVARWTLPLTAKGPLWLALVVQSLLVVPVVLAASAVFFVVLEKPFMAKDWPKKAVARLSRSFVVASGRG